MNAFWIYCFIPFFIFPTLTSAKQYYSTQEASTIRFDISHTRHGLVKGGFSTIESELFWDSQNSVSSNVSCKIYVDSIYTGNRVRDNHLKSFVFFYKKKHPMILFNSDDIRQLSTHTYEANGILIIRGVSIPYTIPFELQYVNEGVRILSKLSILRKPFGLTAYGRLISPTASVTLDMVYNVRDDL